MEAELYTRVALYRAAMALAQEMLNHKLITAEEYGIIDTIMTKKYDINSSTIFR